MPKGFRIGKRYDNGIMVGGKAVFGGWPQIFLECKHPERPGCHDTISIIAQGGNSIDKITDEQAGEIFDSNGWLVKGYNNNAYTRCPHCKSILERERDKRATATETT